MIFRVLLFGAIAFLIWYLIRINSSGKQRCERCKGLGYWEGTRERVTCDWCKGSGYMPK